MSKVASLAAKRALPSKEATLFKDVLTLYETRQLKKGLKTADQILKKYTEHGETMCMKGLILTHMGRRDEGIELVKKGVRLDLTSHICWHVFGLIQKGEKNYEEALKSYMQALRFDKENMNILRDAAALQSQLRLYDGLVDTRHTIVRIRPALRQNWIGLSVAYYLNGNLEEARKVVEHYEETLKNVPDYDVEHSETSMFHVKILEESGDYAEALAFLDVNSKSRAIVDKTGIMETRARLLSKLKSEEAEHAWRVLIDHNPDCTDYYTGYLASLSASDDQARLSILKDIIAQIPRANAPRRLSLLYASGEEFKELAKAYLLSALVKGVPSLFADIKSLYADKPKLESIQNLLEELLAENPVDSASTSTSTSDPTTYLWILYFQAQHFSHLSQYDKALEILERAMAHTPTLPELYTCKARVLKRAGDPYGAARAMEEARRLDGQDRFLNTKCAKYHLRAGLMTEAYSFFGLFTKKDAASPAADLEDMQSLLYLIEDADAHNRMGKLNMALKKYAAIQKIFEEIEDDQYDFHGYSLRKFTINIYLNLLSWEDTLRSHPTYIQAAISASKIFVAVYDDPSIVKKLSPSGQLTDAEKKAAKKAKKAAHKNQDDAKKPAATSTNEDKGLEPASTGDDDPEGRKLLACSDPLERAAKYLHPLTSLAPKNIEAWITVYDVAIRRKKYLQAVQALSHARALDAENPELHVRLVHLRQTIAALPQEPPAPIGPVLKSTAAALLPDEVSLETYNSQYLQRHSSSALAVLATARVSRALGASLQEVENTIFTVLGPEVELTLNAAQSALVYLKELNSTRADEYRVASQEKFPLSTVFKSADEQAALAKATVSMPVASPADEVEV